LPAPSKSPASLRNTRYLIAIATGPFRIHTSESITDTGGRRKPLLNWTAQVAPRADGEVDPPSAAALQGNGRFFRNTFSGTVRGCVVSTVVVIRTPLLLLLVGAVKTERFAQSRELSSPLIDLTQSSA
jgi:hypothetical protein